MIVENKTTSVQHIFTYEQAHKHAHTHTLPPCIRWLVSSRWLYLPSITFMSCLSPKWPLHIHHGTYLCILRERTHTSAQTHTCTLCQRLAELDLQPGTITCDLAPLKLVTNSILGQLIRHAWALGFLYVVIKERVYGHPQALGWMIVLTSSEPEATHSWGGMRGVGRGTPTKLVFDTHRKMTGLHHSADASAFTVALFSS